MTSLHAWLQAHETVLWTLGVVSLLTFAGSLALVPWLVVRIPADYFVGRRRPANRTRGQHPVARALGMVAKNLVGTVLLVAGLAMLLTPGQGLLTLFVGFLLLDFPGKYRLERRIVRAPFILRPLNWIRRRRGRPPFAIDAPVNPGGGSGECRRAGPRTGEPRR